MFLIQRHTAMSKNARQRLAGRISGYESLGSVITSSNRCSELSVWIYPASALLRNSGPAECCPSPFDNRPVRRRNHPGRSRSAPWSGTSGLPPGWWIFCQEFIHDLSDSAIRQPVQRLRLQRDRVGRILAARKILQVRTAWASAPV